MDSEGTHLSLNGEQQQRPGSGSLGKGALVTSQSPGQAREGGLSGQMLSRVHKALPLPSLSSLNVIALPFSSHTSPRGHP